MRTLRNLLFATTLAFTTLFSSATNASDRPRIDPERFAQLDPASQQRVLFIADRLEAIAGMDRSELSAMERKELRSEVRELRREAQAINAAAGGTVLYISTGLLVIILLLIILL